MSLHNCGLCKSVFVPGVHSDSLCADCALYHEAQYKVTSNRIEKLIQNVSFQDVARFVGFAPERVHVYLAYRFGKGTNFIALSGQRRGHCYICDLKMYYPFDSACLDCLQLVQAVLEKRNLYQSSRMGTGKVVKLVLPQDTRLRERQPEDEKVLPLPGEEASALPSSVMGSPEGPRFLTPSRLL